MQGRALDGEINRALEGKRVLAVSKDGVFMTIHCDNGENWNVGWADFVAGRGFAGEPVVIAIDDMIDALTSMPGGVNDVLSGEVIENARVDGTELYFQCMSGRRVGIAWADPATGERVRAEPCLHKVDVGLTLEGVSMFGAEPGNANVTLLVGSHGTNDCGGNVMKRGALFYCEKCGWDNRV